MAVLTNVFGEGRAGVLVEQDGGIVSLVMGTPEQRVVHGDLGKLKAIGLALDHISRLMGIERVILLGQSEYMFCAGYGIECLSKFNDEVFVRELSATLRLVCEKIAALSVPTVCVFSGCCFGIGFEIGLNCRVIVTSDSPHTEAGFPELGLGVMPASGVAAEMTRCSSLDVVLDLLVRGKNYSGLDLYRGGIADHLLACDEEADHYKSVVQMAKTMRIELLEKHALLRMKTGLHYYRNLAQYPRKSHYAELCALRAGHHDELQQAIFDQIFTGLKRAKPKAIASERELFMRMAASQGTQAKLHVYYMAELSKNVGRTARRELQNSVIGIVGGGERGSYLVNMLIRAGYAVCFVETSDKIRQQVAKQVVESLGEREASARFRVGDSFELLRSCRLVFDAVQEDYELKRFVLERLEQRLKDDAVIVTCTMLSPVHILIEQLKHRQRIIGLNLLRPMERSQIAELIYSQQSDARSLAYLASVLNSMGKYPIVVSDVPGYLVMRLLVPAIVVALDMLAEGHHLQDIDDAVVSFGFDKGIFAKVDEIGLERIGKLMALLSESYGPRMQALHFIDELVRAKRLGREVGKGFYSYAGGEIKFDDEVMAVLKLDWRTAKTPRDDIAIRIVAAMLNEAVRCLDEGICGTVGAESASMIDLASVMGCGFPSALGGIVYYAENIGAQKLHKQLHEMMNSYGDRISPVRGIRHRAEQNGSFYKPALQTVANA
ncbi:MAG: enoyl-CoA hydratase/isomerase family protein [Deltaproteobacteria bacterium]|nr:enoyl-CoA hydratase/isomerase family protein [Deltaproteobacteria bacterium]